MDKKAERLDAALRRNLQRRKEQQRAREDLTPSPPAPTSDEESLEPKAKPD